MSILRQYINATADTEIKADTPTTNYGSETTLTMSGLDAGSDKHRSLFRFDLTELYIPSFAHIVSAVFQVEVSSVGDSTANANIYCYECLRDWIETEATWNEYSDGNSWATAGCTGIGDFDTSLLTTVEQMTYEAGDIIEFDLTDKIKASTTQIDLLIRDTVEAFTGSDVVIHSRTSTTGVKPRLAVTYTTEDYTTVNITKDTYIGSSSDASPDEDDWNSGASTLLYTGWNSMRSQFYRSLLAAPLSSVSDVASVDKAILKLTASDVFGQEVTISRLLQTAWVEGTGNAEVTDDGADWASYDGTNLWDAAGASTDGVDFTTSNQTTFTAFTTTGSYIDVTDMVNDALDASKTNIDLIIKRTTESGTNESISIHSSEAAVSANRPILYLYYTSHAFENSTGYCTFGRPTSTQISAFRVAKTGASVAWRLRYWPVGSPDSDITSSVATSTAANKRERLEIVISGLSPNTKYQGLVSENLNNGGWNELSQDVFFATMGGSNTDNTVTLLCSDSHDAQNAIIQQEQHLSEISSVENLVDIYEPHLLIHGGDLSNPSHDYYESTPTSTDYVLDAQENIHRTYKALYKVWEDILAKVPWIVVPGNHERMERMWQYESDPQSNDQVWFTEAWKTWINNPATDFGEDVTEWTLADDVTNEEPWVGSDDSANRPPFENYSATRHGPVEFFCCDVYRYVVADEDSATRFRLGSSQEAQLKADILASTALYRIVVMHHPTGGMGNYGDITDNAETYGRGGIGVAERSMYDWFELFAWFEDNGIDVVFGGHDHVSAVGRMLRKNQRPVFVSMSSPTTPFFGTAGYERGYNANSNDPITGPFDDETPDPDYEALYFESANIGARYGGHAVWVVDANSSRLRLIAVNNWDDEEKTASTTVRYTLDLAPIGQPEPEQEELQVATVVQTFQSSARQIRQVDETVFDIPNFGQSITHYQIVEASQNFDNPLVNISSNSDILLNGNVLVLSSRQLSIVLNHGQQYKFRFRTKSSGTWSGWSAPQVVKIRNKNYKYEIDSDVTTTETSSGSTVVNNTKPSDVVSVKKTKRGATITTKHHRGTGIFYTTRGATIINR